MYCRVCGAQIPDNSKFCSECGANQLVEDVEVKVQQPKVEVVEEKIPVKEEKPRLTKEEKKALKKKRAENTKKLMEEDKKDKDKKQKAISEYKTHYPLLALVFSIASIIVSVLPIELTWWYCLIVIAIAFYGTYYARRAREINDELYEKYRLRIHPVWIRVSFILSCLSMGVAFILLMGIIF